MEDEKHTNVNTIQSSFIRFQSYDTIILSKIQELQLLVDTNPDDEILREYLAIWKEIHETRISLLPAWNNALEMSHK
jgi:hypothetical protein